MLHVCFVLVISILFSAACFAQQSPRDPQGLQVATQAYNALGGLLPVDSRAQGTFDRTIGSSEDTGTVEILTRNLDQTSETLATSTSTAQSVYSRGYSSHWEGTTVAKLALETSLANSSILFPLLVIAPAIQDPNSAVHFIGSETINGILANHIQICISSPDQNFDDIVSFATKDVWVAADTGLPLQITVQVFDSEGSPAVPLMATFDSYQTTSGLSYPTHIQVFSNGTPYNLITITSVAFNVGLTDDSFPLR